MRVRPGGAGSAAVHAGTSGTQKLPFIPRAVVNQIVTPGWLESWWVRAGLIALLALSVLLLAVTVLRRRRRRRAGGPRRTGRLVAAIALVVVSTVLAAAGLVNAYVGYVPNNLAVERLVGVNHAAANSAAAAPGSGAVRRYLIGAPALDIPPSPVWVYLPPGYGGTGSGTGSGSGTGTVGGTGATARRYPVIYLLHGYPGRSVDWFAAGRIDATMNLLIDSGIMPPAIVVAPDMNAGALARDTEGLNIVNGPQVQTYLTSTIPAWVDATFRTIPAPSARIIGGMSAGGYVALNLGLRYQDVFGGILGQEPYGDPGRSTLPLLGYSRAAFAAQSPSHYLPTMRFARQEPTFIDVGSQADVLTTWKLALLLRLRGQPVYFRVEAGQGHTWTEARLGVAYGLVWMARQLGWSGAGGTALNRS